MFSRITAFVQRYISRLARIVEVILIGCYFVSRFVPVLAAWMRDQHVIELVILIILVELVRTTSDVRSSLSTADVTILSDQSAASLHLANLLQNVTHGDARIVGYSAGQRKDAVNLLRNKGWQLRMLLQQPTSALNPPLRDHLLETLREFVRGVYGQDQAIIIRVFSGVALFRALHLDKVGIYVGWYTRIGTHYDLTGHTNPVVFARAGSLAYERLSAMFDKTFTRLWEDSSTVAAAEVI